MAETLKNRAEVSLPSVGKKLVLQIAGRQHDASRRDKRRIELGFLVEGQAEYLVVPALARSMGYDLDEQGVALIDAVNNGNPTTFAILARALSIPWLAVFDGDDAGRGYWSTVSTARSPRPP